MARREYHISVKCAEEGCGETMHYSYSNKKEYTDACNRHKGKKCLRHSNPEKVLSPDNRIIVSEEVASKSEKFPNLKGLFWSNNGSGFTYGSNYRAYAKDFPEGTILRVTAEIILPESN